MTDSQIEKTEDASNPLILVLDDEVAIAQLVAGIFEAEGFDVVTFYDPREALEAATKLDIELALVDIMMPYMDGFEFVQRLKRFSDAAVIFLTAKDEEPSVLVGFALGADDYIVKPFKPRELVARVKARIRKSSRSEVQKSNDAMLEVRGIELSRREHTASLYGIPLSLTPKEFDILACLMENAGQPVSTANLYTQVWNTPADASSANTVMVHIRHLRCKLAEIDSSVQFISNAWGVGYMIASSQSKGIVLKMAQRSEQAKLLTRSLLVQLLRDLIVFTIIFGFAAATINTFLVPRIANFVADSTTEWKEYRYDSISLLKAVEVLEGDLFATAQSWDEALAIYNQEDMEAFDIKEDSSAVSSIVIEESAEDAKEKYRYPPGSENGIGSDDSFSSGDALVRIIRSNTFELLPAFSSEEIEVIPANTPLVLFFKLGETPYWTSPFDLRSRAITQLYVYSTDFTHNQIVYRSDSIAIRDISLYLAIKQFKIPLAIILYLTGFAIILVIGFRRALKYFDELSAAVGSIVAHTDKPIKLSRPLRSTEDELNAIRDASLADERAAQAAERRKDELVAYLAHDVKTPITSVIGYLSLLDEVPDIPEEQRRRYIKTALVKSERLEELIDEFFEITRYNLQAIPIERAQVSIELFCQQVVEEFYPDAEARKLTITVDAPSDATFFVDPDKFARALGNVVRNAIAHANTGTTVTISVEKTEALPIRWKLSVTDEGREISPAHLESIFDKFYRATPARDSQSGRAGLGLAIAKEIVVAHGGSIEACSENGKTTFAIYLPI